MIPDTPHALEPRPETKHDVLNRLWTEIRAHAQRNDRYEHGAPFADADPTQGNPLLPAASAEQERFIPYSGVTESTEASLAVDPDVSDVSAAAGPDFSGPPAAALGARESFILLSLLVPHLDSDHPLLHMKASRLAQHYIEALDIPRHCADASWLLNYSDETYRPNYTPLTRHYVHAKAGNFPSVLHAVLKDRCRRQREDSFLSIQRVWEMLSVLYSNKDAPRGSRFLAYSAHTSRQDATSHGQRTSQAYGEPETTTEMPTSDRSEPVRGDVLRARKERRLEVLRELVRDGTAEENAEFARIVLKDAQMGLSEDALLRWFHPSAKQHYYQTHDLKRLIRDCQDPSFTIGEVEVTPGRYASVMLTARPARARLERLARTLSTVVPDGANDDISFTIEPKLDGERLQLHKIGETVMTFSRSAKNSSDMYAHILAPAVHLSVAAHTAIFDGEVVLWDENARSWLPFESFRETVTRIRTGRVDREADIVLKYLIFDVLYISHAKAGQESSPLDAAAFPTQSTEAQLGQSGTEEPKSPESTALTPRGRAMSHSLLNFPHWQRMVVLKRNVTAVTTAASSAAKVAVEVISSRRGSSEKDLLEALNAYVDEGYEGIIAKNPSKPYMLAERQPNAAIKLKPDYFEGGLQDLDVVILGAKYGTGSGNRTGRIGTLSSFLVGVRTHDTPSARMRYLSGVGGSWTPIGAVGTGYTDAELARLRRRLAGHWKRLEKGRENFPHFWDTSRAADNMFRDVAMWIDPRESALLQVRAYELYHSGRRMALRFPRCDRIRAEDEKPIWEAISVDELIELDSCKMPATVSSSHGADGDEVMIRDPSVARKRRMSEDMLAARELHDHNAHVTRAGGGKRRALPHASGACVSDIHERGHALAGCSVHVLARHGQANAKHQLERRLFRLGADFEQSITSRTTHVIALDGEHHRVRLSESAACSEHSQLSSQQEASSLDCPSVLRPCWVDDCERADSAVALTWRHVLVPSPSLKDELDAKYDRLGDPLSAPSTEVSILESFQAAAAHGGLLRGAVSAASDPEVKRTAQRVMRQGGAAFWNVGIVVYESTRPGVLRGVALLARYFGADVTYVPAARQMRDIALGSPTDYVVVEGDTTPSAESREAVARDPMTSESVPIVTASWVYDSIRLGYPAAMNYPKRKSTGTAFGAAGACADK